MARVWFPGLPGPPGTPRSEALSQKQIRRWLRGRALHRNGAWRSAAFRRSWIDRRGGVGGRGWRFGGHKIDARSGFIGPRNVCGGRRIAGRGDQVLESLFAGTAASAAPLSIMRSSTISDPPVAAKSNSTENSQLRWPVEALVMGDGSTGRSGAQVERGRLFASGQARCAHENFFGIHWDSTIFSSVRDHAFRLPTYVLPGANRQGETPACMVPARGRTRRAGRKSREEIVAEIVRAFLMRHPGVVVIVHRVGARGPSPELEGMRLPGSGLIAATRQMYDCVEAALINGISALQESCATQARAADVAKEAVARENKWFLNFKPLGPMVNRMQKELKRAGLNGLQVVKLPEDEVRSVMRCRDRMQAFHWLAKRKRGVYIVRIRQQSLVDHAICVDAGRGAIIDSEELYPLRLSAEALNLCGGSTAKNLRVVEIRQLRPKIA